MRGAAPLEGSRRRELWMPRCARSRGGRGGRGTSTRPHDLRHGWATRALEAGLSPKVVQEILGHASSQVTLDIYSHVVPSLKADATQLVADLIAGTR
jgi:integrase